MNKIIKKNSILLNTNREGFKTAFNVELTRFMHPVMGFNIVLFDDFLHSVIDYDDNISLKENLIKSYNEDACEIIEGLLS
jgi:hypothetical protein